MFHLYIEVNGIEKHKIIDVPISLPIDGGQSSSCIFFEPMSENECRGEPYVRPRTETDIEPMPEGERFI
jgi:hypothetical protein